MFPNTPKTLLQKISELAQGDDRAEWEAFVELYTPPLTRFVRCQSPAMSDTDIEDVVQDVFVRLVTVLREAKIDRTKAKFRAYLASMTRRILIDRYRAAQFRPELAEGSVPTTMEGSELVDMTDPGATVDILWRISVRAAAKNHIFTKTAISDQSKLIYERLEQGLSPRKVADEVGVSYDSVKQVKSRLDRAIAAVEERMLAT